MASIRTMSITITPRIRLVLHRFCDVYFEEAIKQGLKRKQTDDDFLMSTRVRDLEISYDVYVPHHDNDCHYLDEGEHYVSADDDCDCDAEYEFVVSLFYSQSKLRVFLSDFTFTENTDKVDVLAWLDTLKDEYHLCHCANNLVVKEGWCYTCYIHRYEREEPCCICMDNDGRWVKLGCGHEIHRHCWGNLATSVCPLCRQAIVVSEITFDPFNA